MYKEMYELKVVYIIAVEHMNTSTVNPRPEENPSSAKHHRENPIPYRAPPQNKPEYEENHFADAKQLMSIQPTSSDLKLPHPHLQSNQRDLRFY
jgi:hypothetical protein